MTFFNVVSLLGGLALFLYGMNAMGDGLAKASGGKMESILEKLTAKRIKAVLLGAGVTAVIQSSSATTVMVVGFVNSGIMKLSQAVGIIFGANIGTTVTAWILSLSGISSDNFFVQLLKPNSWAPILALIGIVLILFSKKEKKKDTGSIMVNFAILMTGMELMSSAVSPLKNDPTFTSLFTMFQNPILGLLTGALLTAIIQSSSASVGILQALCSTGAITFGSAIPIILGQNIGTCVTAMISSIGASKNAKRAAFVHLYFNIIGAAVFMAIFYGINAFVKFEFLDSQINEFWIAVVHTSFNVAATILLMPFANQLEKLATLTVRDKKVPKAAALTEIEQEQSRLQLLDPRFLEKPAFAVEQSKKAAGFMADVAYHSIIEAINLLRHYDENNSALVARLEDVADLYEDELGDYLVKLSAKSLNEKDSKTVSKLLHSLSDLERISDHALNLMQAAKEMHDKNIEFSKDAKEELKVFLAAIEKIMELAVESYKNDDKNMAAYVEPLEEVIDGINEECKSRHIKRLRQGTCTIELGFILSDISTNLERVADHCSNLAVATLKMESDDYEAHNYLGHIKEEDPKFKEFYHEFRKEYVLP